MITYTLYKYKNYGAEDIMETINQDDELFYEFESWETDHDLIEKKDYEGLIKYRKKCLDRHPNDSYSKWSFGEAYVMAKKYQIALDYFISIYQESYEDPNVQASILDALFALGKCEQEFEWIIEPKVMRIEEGIECCKKKLKGKRKSVAILELHFDLLMEGYLLFSLKELLSALIRDDNFDLVENEFEMDSTVKLRRKVKIKK